MKTAKRYTITPVPQPELSTARVWEVAGGSEPYVVKCTEFNTEWVCSCTGFFYRKSCKHVDLVKDLEDSVSPRLFESDGA